MDLLDNGYNLILVYMVAGLAGTLWETILFLVRDKRFVISNGSVFTPFNFVYGFGGICVIITLYKLVNYPFLVFIVGGLLGGSVEYLLSFLEQKICHTQSWDYKGRILNINGRTTVPLMFFWGLLCIAVMYIAYIPFCEYVINRFFIDTELHHKIYHIIMLVSIAYILIDLTLVVSIMIRSSRRKQNIEAGNFYSRFLDKFFPESYVSKHFPNSKHVS